MAMNSNLLNMFTQLMVAIDDSGQGSVVAYNNTEPEVVRLWSICKRTFAKDVFIDAPGVTQEDREHAAENQLLVMIRNFSIAE